MPAKTRNSEIASLLEDFLDENENNLPPAMFSELDALAEEIDSLVKEKDEEIEDLESQKEAFEKQIAEMEDSAGHSL